MSKRAALLEVIACSVADAVEAEQGGAKRLEIISDFARGGLTPPLELVVDILAIVSLPVRVMLRENEGYEIGSEPEKRRLFSAAHEFSRLRIDGLVLGFLRKGRIDLEVTQQILECAPRLKATFHHAFEETEPFPAIREIKKLKQVDRILTSGGGGEWPEKIARLGRYQEEASPEIEIIAGGGLASSTIRRISATTGIREFHVGRAARVKASVDGVVKAARVKVLVEATRDDPRNHTKEH
ncbi:MAG: copper homeostasis protein CutC [Pyrinomonadaceae bacterium]